ncbi:MAG: universal stress protein [Reyranella sp.]|jgi:nucleotide-binding universal stress UspA family protein|uniref:universal stress protein n=1 Tax=Reyranella sp. TaxID=1929291 RepID=UPI000968D10D|nr:universal stress protein [Reyranella sp.]MBN9538293.1 universal stress protein [Alphaproteobacteria bacterium]MBR2817672.1 universal stress protein [Reyranella sp.]OJU45404.1 MAG: universal stress protein [Alphaproteobacteria bacterium 65-37]
MNGQPGTGERVFLVVVDESPEMRKALRYACRRAKRTGGRVAMLNVMDPPEAQQWGAVVELMREEARQQAELLLAQHAEVVVSLTGQPPATYIREGKSRDELAKLLSEDKSISVLVLGSASGVEGPGPLVTAFTGKLGSQLRIPLTIVPGALTDAEIDAIS